MNKTYLRTVASIMLGVMILSLFSGCLGKRYSVDYSGQKDFYSRAKDSYRAGEKVEMFFEHIATDTDYSFFLDGERLNPLYDDAKGFVISFTMPAHDVVLECRSRNSMIAEPEEQTLVDYYSAIVGTVGGDRYTELILTRIEDGTLRLDVLEGDADGNETSVSYAVPDEAYERCREIIDSNSLRKWNDLEDADCLDGAFVSCRFLDTNGEYVRVSTDQMPSDGKAILDGIGSVLRSYAKD